MVIATIKLCLSDKLYKIIIKQLYRSKGFWLSFQDFDFRKEKNWINSIEMGQKDSTAGRKLASPIALQVQSPIFQMVLRIPPGMT